MNKHITRIHTVKMKRSETNSGNRSLWLVSHNLFRTFTKWLTNVYVLELMYVHIWYVRAYVVKYNVYVLKSEDTTNGDNSHAHSHAIICHSWQVRNGILYR